MIEKSRIFVGISLFLIIITLIFHLTAIGVDRWKIYEYRYHSNTTFTIGLFHRCEKHQISIAPNLSKVYSICDNNKYCFHGNAKCDNLSGLKLGDNMQKGCNADYNPYDCVYSSIAKGLIACTIIAACALGLSLILIFSHIFINQFKYKIHMYVTIVTIVLLLLGLIFILITLIILGATLAYDLYQYRYNLDYRMASPGDMTANDFKQNIISEAHRDYDVRLDRGGILEIVALILSSFTLVTQILYLLFIYRNRTG